MDHASLVPSPMWPGNEARTMQPVKAHAVLKFLTTDYYSLLAKGKSSMQPDCMDNPSMHTLTDKLSTDNNAM